MGLIWVLLLQENAHIYVKSILVTFRYLSLLSRLFKFSQERNMVKIVFKSCHSDQFSRGSVKVLGFIFWLNKGAYVGWWCWLEQRSVGW